MKIAVASVDGANVASSITAASCFLVFPVDGNQIEAPERRMVREVSARSVPLVRGTVESTIPASGAGIESPSEAPETNIPDDHLRALLDCSLVIAGGIPVAHQKQLRLLGLLALPVFEGEAAELAVRFAVAGSPPEEGEACGHCPNRTGAAGTSASATPVSQLPILVSMAK